MSEQNKIKMGIVGHGFVGQAVDYAFNHFSLDKFYVDPKHDTTIDDLVDWEPDFVFVCLPTPQNKETGFVDASLVEDAVLKLIEHTKSLVIVKSTITPDVVDRICNSFFDENCVDRFVYNPEFLSERNSKDDFVNYPFHVFGSNPKGLQNVTQIYEFFSNCLSSKYFLMSPCEASFVKYAINSYLALKVTFFNELEKYVTKFNCSYNMVQKAVTSDKRVGPSHSFVPGFDGKRGFGGACLPKDLKAFTTLARSDSSPLELLEKVTELNNSIRSEYELDEREKINNIEYDN